MKLAHTTILRWTLRFVPEFEKRWDRFRRRAGGSWRMDETYVCIHGPFHYLYRAVEQYGQRIDFLLRRDRGISTAQAFFRKALNSNGQRFPRTVTLYGHVPSRSALWKLRRFKSFVTAAVTLAGFELAHRIRKRQFNFKRRGVASAAIGESTGKSLSRSKTFFTKTAAISQRAPEPHPS